MLETKQLPYLLDLLEDESDEVRNAVVKELSNLGNRLEWKLRNVNPPLNEAKIRIALYLVEDYLNRFSGGIQDIESEIDVKKQRLFLPGHIVHHRKYGYRGVIVDYDMICKAEDDWFSANFTANSEVPPPKNQPWYYVLVDLSNRVTYAAQNNIEEDGRNKKIVHPLLKVFFISFENGYYVRNTKPWPKMGGEENSGDSI